MSKPYYNIGGTSQSEFIIRVGSDGIAKLRYVHDDVDEADLVFAAPDATSDKELQLFGGVWVTDFDDSDPIRGVRLGGAYLALESTDISMQLHSAQVGCRVVVAGLTERGNALLAVEAPPTPDYIENVTNSVDATIYSAGSLPSAWVNVCDLLTITQDIDADEATVFFELLVENTGTKDGVFEIGISLNGAAPTAANSIQYPLSAGIQQIYANTSINASFLANGTTARLQARGISAQATGFAVVAKNSVRPSRLKVSIVGTGGGAIGANPTGTVGLTAVNGSALTWMRSDAAPPLSQSIAPTWLGAHRFDAAVDFRGEFRSEGVEGVAGQVWSAQGAGLPAMWRTAAGASIDLGYNFNTSTAATDPGAQKLAYNQTSYAATTILRIDSIAFANFAADTILSLLQAGNRVYMQQRNDATKAAVFEVTGVGVDQTGYWNIPVVLIQSRGTLFINNADLTVVFILSTSSSASADPTGTVGLTVVNGSATTWMRSDAAPPLSVAILPTWTGRHIFGGSDPQIQLTNSGAPTNEKFSSLRVTSAGTFGLYSSLDASSGTMVTAALLASRTGAAWDNISFGNATDNPTFTFVGSGVTTFSAIPVVPNDSWTYAKIQNVSATSRVLGRITSGAGDIEELTGANLTTIIGGAALTKTDDTNVTLTLGGTPATALLVAASLTLGWTGTLAVARGGSGAATLTGYLKGNGTSAFTAVATIPYSDITGGPSASSGANPTGTVGLTAVNGSAVTFLRSDGAPALDVTIAPTWSGVHSFTASSTRFGTTASLSVGNSALVQQFGITAQTASHSVVRGAADANGPRLGLGKTRSTSYDATVAVQSGDQLGVVGFFGADATTLNTLAAQIVGHCSGTVSTGVVPGEIRFSNMTAAGALTEDFRMSSFGGLGIAGANYGTAGQVFTSGGSAAATSWSNPALVAANFANPSATLGLAAVNGSAITAMRSDAAPALSVAIVPTWSGIHTFSARPVFNDGITVNDSARQVASLVDTAHSYGNTTDNPTYTYLGTGLMAVHGQASIGDGSANGDRLRLRNSTAVGVGTNYHHYFNLASNTQLHLYAWDGASTNIGVLRISHVQVFHADGTVSNPVLSFNSDPNTGIYSGGADTIAFATGGAQQMQITADAVYIDDGTFSLPGLSFLTDGDTGMYRAAANRIGFSTLAIARLLIDSAWIETTLPFGVPDGLVSAPSYYFSADPNTGLYRIGSDNFAATAGNSKVMEWLAAASGGAKVADPAGTMENVGYRRVPRSTTTTTIAIGDIGKCIAITAAINIPISVFSAGDAISLYNDSSGALNITISAGTLRLAGSASTGTRSLAARGICTLWFNVGGATPEVIANGNVT